MTVCIIPARGGSKRIKNKNIKKFAGFPMISHVIKMTVNSGLFSKVIVSTDSKKIAKISKNAGAEVPFLREKKLAGDKVSTFDVLKDVINKLYINNKFFVCIYPTAVLINSKQLKKALFKIKKNNFDQLIAIKKFNNSPWRGLKKNKNLISSIFKKYYKFRSQDLSDIYHDTGTFYIFKTKKYINSKGNFLKKTTFYELDIFSGIDINYKDDFKLAEIIYNLRK